MLITGVRVDRAGGGGGHLAVFCSYYPVVPTQV